MMKKEEPEEMLCSTEQDGGEFSDKVNFKVGSEHSK